MDDTPWVRGIAGDVGGYRQKGIDAVGFSIATGMKASADSAGAGGDDDAWFGHGIETAPERLLHGFANRPGDE